MLRCSSIQILNLLRILLIFFILNSQLYADDVYQSNDYSFKLVSIAHGLERPWGLAFLPNKDLLITERVGRLRIVRQGQLDSKPIEGLPDNIYAAGQGVY